MLFIIRYLKTTQMPLAKPENDDHKTNLLVHGRCSSLAKISLLGLGIGDTLGEGSGVFVLVIS
jgi:hypothetical protein